MRDMDPEITIVGAGIGGLTLALELHRHGIPCRIYEAAPEIGPLGVGINLLPHSTKILRDLGLEESLDAKGVRTREAVFYTRHGQFIHAEGTGRHAGYETAQYSIHRGDLQSLLLNEVRTRLGDEAVVTDHKCLGFEQDDDSVTLKFERSSTGDPLPDVVARTVIGCDGIHSAIRKTLYPTEGPPRYSGVTMWRGVTVAPPFLTGASMARIGWLASGKLVVYPIRDDVDGRGSQLINWVAELETPQRTERSWTKEGLLEDIWDTFGTWSFDWLDVPYLLENSEMILEYPMVDQDPLPQWTFGQVTLLGDAAHPMLPRGSNGAGQSIVDAHRLAAWISQSTTTRDALTEYEKERLPATSAVVLANRTTPPDRIIEEVWRRTDDQPFDRIEDVISEQELTSITDEYKKTAGYSLAALNSPETLPSTPRSY